MFYLDGSDWGEFISSLRDEIRSFYRHKLTGIEISSSEDEEKMLCKDAYNEGSWEIVVRIGNKYNREVVFNGRLSHMSDIYFGEDKDTGRLFQTFFFNVAK